MPVRHLIDPERGLVRTEYFDDLSDVDIREHARALRADPLFVDTMPELTDVTAATTFSATAEMLNASARSRLKASDARHAFVVQSHEQFVIAEAYRRLRQSAGATEVMVFRSAESAIEWLTALPV